MRVRALYDFLLETHKHEVQYQNRRRIVKGQIYEIEKAGNVYKILETSYVGRQLLGKYWATVTKSELKHKFQEVRDVRKVIDRRKGKASVRQAKNLRVQDYWRK